MKGFPNQIADLTKLASGMRCLVDVLEKGDSARDDGVFGQALVRSGVAGTGHNPMPVEDYIRKQLKNPLSGQSFRTTARGLRELYSLLGLISDDGESVTVTSFGRQATAFADQKLNTQSIKFWRLTIRNINHFGGDEEASHPYQVLLRLIGQRPGISRAKCALALEARNDSAQELERIVTLSDLTEDEIVATIRVTQTNWNNAKKILPKFAEQLGDVIKEDGSYTIANAPGDASSKVAPKARQSGRILTPNTSRQVTPNTIGRAGTADEFDEIEIPPMIDSERLLETINVRRDRLRRHNFLVKDLASYLIETELFEDPFDILSVHGNVGILVEVKTLNGETPDERKQVRNALSQLLYYEAFVASPVAGEAEIHKVAYFEKEISEEHQAWLNKSGIAVVWQKDNKYCGDELAATVLGRYIEELV